MQRGVRFASIVACCVALSCGDPLLPVSELIGEYELISINGSLPAAFPAMTQATGGHLHLRPDGDADYSIGGFVGPTVGSQSFAAVGHQGTWRPARSGVRFDGTGPITSFRYADEKLSGDFLGHALVFQLTSRSITH